MNLLKVNERENTPAFSPTMENVSSGNYPISRYLYIYTSGNPTGEIAYYIRWVLDEDGGQKVAEHLGFIPLPNYIIEEELEKIL